MKKFVTETLGIDQGSVIVSQDFSDGGEMWTGRGVRNAEKKVEFNKPFLRPPLVYAGFSMVDISNEHYLRVRKYIGEVSTVDFIIGIETWADTKIARIAVDWLAFGEIAHSEKWD